MVDIIHSFNAYPSLYRAILAHYQPWVTKKSQLIKAGLLSEVGINHTLLPWIISNFYMIYRKMKLLFISGVYVFFLFLKLKFTTQHTMMIPDEAYKNNLDLVEFEIPEGTRHIGKSAFAGCENLRSIIIPNSVTVIGEAAFWGCRSLQSVVVPKKVRTIRNEVFYNCYQLKSITLPQGLQSIGDCAFSKCFELDNLVVPSSVKRIGEFAFDRCDHLKHIVMPSDIQIAENAFGVDKNNIV